jgi:glycosyltransferase involved in cell wall biosynthesis
MDYPTMSINGLNSVSPSPTRILHFIESGGLYGAERVILNLSREMICSSELVPVVGCIVSTEAEESDLYDAAVSEGIEAVKLVIPNNRFPLALPGIVKQLKQLNVALIHSHGYKPSVYGFLLKILSGIPVIATCHLWFEMDRGPLKTRILIALEKRLYRWFPRVVAVSDDIRKILIENDMPEDKVTVVENGVSVDPGDTADQSAFLRQSLGLGANDFCVLNAGRLTRQKAQWTLVEAAAVLKRRQVHIKVLIAGEGSLKDSLMEQINQLQVQDRVKLLGFRRDIPELLAMSDVFALPSLDEGMPMILLESTARGVPAIVTGVGDIPKLIHPNETGLVIPKEDPESLADAIESLLHDKSLRDRLADNARSRMKVMYSSQAMHQKYSEIYQDLLSGVQE